MATDMFIEINGIEGESKDKEKVKKKAIDVLAWSWGMSQSGSFHTGGGGGAGKVNVQDISFTKYIDKATAPLMLACCNGEHIDNAILTVRKAGQKKGAPALEYLVIKLSKLMVTSVSTGGSSGEEQLTENVTINFAAFEVNYSMQKDDGSGEAAGTVTWDIEANAE